jgi:membrane-bound lytic murein transglycosylase D
VKADLKKWNRRLLLTALTGLIGGCASHSEKINEAPIPDELVDAEMDSESDQELEQDDLDDVTIPEKKQLILRSEIPVELNEEVMGWVKFFSKKERDRFESYLVRGTQYKNLIQEIFRKNSLPPELYYLALIESGFVHHARSSASAVGYWQFMRPTGIQYGLRISPYVDERQDIVRATQAAAKYLKWLFAQFDDWHLTLAAYNAGPGRIKGAIRRSGIKDYWKLSKRGFIPRETRSYVPQFMAALIIGSFPERFNFEIPAAAEIPDIKPVQVPSPIKITDLARLSNVSESVIEKLNPHLKAGYTPPNTSKYYVWMPASMKIGADDLITKLLPFRKDARLFAGGSAVGGGAFRTHIVRKGETLNIIARRYRKSMTQLKDENGLRSGRILVGQALKIPGYGNSKSSFKRARFYVVKRGDSLASIAQKFKVSVSALRQSNALRGSVIYKGQSLKIAGR